MAHRLAPQFQFCLDHESVCSGITCDECPFKANRKERNADIARDGSWRSFSNTTGHCVLGDVGPDGQEDAILVLRTKDSWLLWMELMEATPVNEWEEE